MKKAVVMMLGAGCVISFLFSSYYAVKIYQNERVDVLAEENETVSENRYRIVLISSEKGNPFWEDLRKGVREASEAHRVSVQFWGTFRSNTEEILKNMDIGIAAKVDGMIVEGMDDPAFVQTVNFASERGIPVITIVTDSPESLRRSYVGSDHVLEGRRIAQSIVSRMKAGKIGFVTGGSDTHAFRLRTAGIMSELEDVEKIQIVRADDASRRKGDVRAETAQILNQHPDCRVFVGFRSGSASGIFEEIRMRSREDLFSIYTFDDLPETLKLFEQGVVTATIRHEPKTIGATSLERMVQWLDNEPLERHYYIPFEMMERDRP